MSPDVILTAVIVALSGAVSGAAGFLGAKFGALEKKIEAKIAASPTKIDDALLTLAKRFAHEIVRAKQEDPATPLGTPPAPPVAP